MWSCQSLLQQGIQAQVPNYDFTTHCRLETKTTLSPTPVILIEGIYALYDIRFRESMHLKIFIDADCDVRLSRRVRRDIVERKRNINDIVLQYTRFVKPAFEKYVYPTRTFADVIIPHGVENNGGVDVIINYIQSHVRESQQ
jgi:uridine kinase